MTGSPMLAVIPVRGGRLPAGAAEVVAEAAGEALIAGEGTVEAAAQLDAGGHARCVELGAFAPGAWAQALAPLLAGVAVVVLPASPDGRDLAPRLAHRLGRPLLAGALAVSSTRATLARHGGLTMEEHAVEAPVVATLIPGVRGHRAVGPPATSMVTPPTAHDAGSAHDAEVLAVIPPDPATADLAEVERIVAGGAGLGGPGPFATLRRVATALRASYGGSRVAADLGWVPQDRFIGTTGAGVDPRLYICLGISGAVQHLTGLGNPDHLVAVNTDAGAPVMAIADLAIVTDAPALLDALAARLAVAR